MAVHKLKPIEERDPYAAAVLEAFDSLGDKMNPIERELKTMRGFAACLHDEHCLDEADKELARLLAIEAAARNLVKVKGRYHTEQAFKALAALLVNDQASTDTRAGSGTAHSRVAGCP